LPPSTGILAANDEIASLILAACRRLSLNVPSEIAVLGVDNDIIRCENEYPSLSSIHLDFEGAGYMAGELLERRISFDNVAPQM
jgi:LacI family transcriptional regulator